ncbi:hypothetical protein D3C85_947610 [compost metagenome]
MVDTDPDRCVVHDTIFKCHITLILPHALTYFIPEAHRPRNEIIEHNITDRLRVSRPAKTDICRLIPRFRRVRIIQSNADTMLHKHILGFIHVDAVVLTHIEAVQDFQIFKSQIIRPCWRHCP